MTTIYMIMNLVRATHPRTTVPARLVSTASGPTRRRVSRRASGLRAAVPCGSGCARLRDLSDCV